MGHAERVPHHDVAVGDWAVLQSRSIQGSVWIESSLDTALLHCLHPRPGKQMIQKQEGERRVDPEY